MGSTYIQFNGKGFEANDSTLEVWLHLLVEEIDKIHPAPKWLQEVRDEWHLQSTAGFGFGVMPDLDNFASDDQRREAILGLSERALERLRRYGSEISKNELNAMQTGGGAIFTTSLPTSMFVKVGQYFIKLLNGGLRKEESDARPFPSEE